MTIKFIFKDESVRCKLKWVVKYMNGVEYTIIYIGDVKSQHTKKGVIIFKIILKKKE